jgi:hypothetical protein
MNPVTHIHAPTTITHGNDLARAALALTYHAERPAGQHDNSMRELFAGAIDLLQRQAKRVALAQFDNASFQAGVEEAARAAKAESAKRLAEARR